MKDILVVNFMGCSCSGKSGHSAGLFSALKKAGISVELSREYCKNFFYEETRYKLDNQMLITGKQIEQVETFKQGGIDVVIMDSPIIMGAVYKQVYGINIILAEAIRQEHHKYNNFNILMESDVNFEPEGRGHSGVERGHIFNLIQREGLEWHAEYKTTELKSYKLLVNAIKRKLIEMKVDIAVEQEEGHFDIGRLHD